MKTKLLLIALVLVCGSAQAVPAQPTGEDKVRAEMKAQEAKNKAAHDKKEQERKAQEKSDARKRKREFDKSGKSQPADLQNLK